MLGWYRLKRCGWRLGPYCLLCYFYRWGWLWDGNMPLVASAAGRYYGGAEGHTHGSVVVDRICGCSPTCVIYSGCWVIRQPELRNWQALFGDRRLCNGTGSYCFGFEILSFRAGIDAICVVDYDYRVHCQYPAELS